jgi:hypothetical protein
LRRSYFCFLFGSGCKQTNALIVAAAAAAASAHEDDGEHLGTTKEPTANSDSFFLLEY